MSISSSYLTLYVEATLGTQATGYIPLYVHQGNTTGYIPIFIGPAIESVSSGLPLSLTGTTSTILPASSYMPMFVQVDDTEVVTLNIPLYVAVNDTIYSDIPIYVAAVDWLSDSIPLFLIGVGYKTNNAGPFDNSGYFPFGQSLDIFINRATYSEAIDIFVYCEDTAPSISPTITATTTVVTTIGIISPSPTANIPLYIRGKP